MKQLPSRSGEPDPRQKRKHSLTGHEPAAPAPGSADGDQSPLPSDTPDSGDQRMRGSDKSGGQRGGGR
jgi:hypothetical protein